MPRKFFKTFTPSRELFQTGWLANAFGEHLHAHDLWHLHRHTVSAAFFVGVFVAFIPLPAQMFIAAAIAIVIRCHLPIAVITVWLSNPLTMPAIFYGNYLLGCFLLQVDAINFAEGLSFNTLKQELMNVWKPLLVGSAVAGFFFGSLSYGTVRLLWRALVVRRWRKRQRRHLS